MFFPRRLCQPEEITVEEFEKPWEQSQSNGKVWSHVSTFNSWIEF